MLETYLHAVFEGRSDSIIPLVHPVLYDMVLYRDPDPFQQDDFGFNIQRRPGGGGHSTVYDRRAPRRISWDRDQGGDVVPGTLHDTDRRRPSRDRVRRYP